MAPVSTQLGNKTRLDSGTPLVAKRSSMRPEMVETTSKRRITNDSMERISRRGQRQRNWPRSKAMSSSKSCTCIQESAPQHLAAASDEMTLRNEGSVTKMTSGRRKLSPISAGKLERAKLAE